jgi:hypothetical protein
VGNEHQLWTVRPFTASNANVPQCSHTSHGAPVNNVSVSLDTFPPAYPVSFPRHWVARRRSIWASLILATRPEARTSSEFHSHLLHAVILTKPHNSVLGTIADTRAVLFPLSVPSLTLALFCFRSRYHRWYSRCSVSVLLPYRQLSSAHSYHNLTYHNYDLLHDWQSHLPAEFISYYHNFRQIPCQQILCVIYHNPGELDYVLRCSLRCYGSE